MSNSFKVGLLSGLVIFSFLLIFISTLVSIDLSILYLPVGVLVGMILGNLLKVSTDNNNNNNNKPTNESTSNTDFINEDKTI
jgi:hypothetical protein